jgi:hypothetical protein
MLATFCATENGVDLPPFGQAFEARNYISTFSSHSKSDYYFAARKLKFIQN